MESEIIQDRQAERWREMGKEIERGEKIERQGDREKERTFVERCNPGGELS